MIRAPLPDDLLTNSQVSELLANAGEDAKSPLSTAYRHASRRGLLWPEEASSLYQAGRSLTELPGVGPYLEKPRFLSFPWLGPSEAERPSGGSRFPIPGGAIPQRGNQAIHTNFKALLKERPSETEHEGRN
jgi:hypothetical protein